MLEDAETALVIHVPQANRAIERGGEKESVLRPREVHDVRLPITRLLEFHGVTLECVNGLILKDATVLLLLPLVLCDLPNFPDVDNAVLSSCSQVLAIKTEEHCPNRVSTLDSRSKHTGGLAAPDIGEDCPVRSTSSLLF